MKRSTIIALVAGGVAVLLLLNLVVYVKVVRPVLAARASYIMAGPSMEPTLKDGDPVRTRKAQPGALQRGDIVVVTDPGKPDRLLIKRVVALGGDEVELRAGVLYLNGSAVSEPYAVKGQTAGMPRLKVPAGQVFLLGDNRAMSLDSRAFGPVPANTVKAVVIQE